jgi:small subunit ribosomal protein S17
MEKEMNQEPKKVQPQERKKGELILTGEVVSNKIDKTITVSVPRNFQHPVYGKIVTRRKKYLAHDETNRCKPGDTVRIKLIKPISKRKRWLLVEVVSTAPDKENLPGKNINNVEVPQ